MYRTLSAPLNCQFEVTTACENKCLHCYNHWRASTEKDVPLTSENGRKIMHVFAKAGVHEITFTGGEPLMNFDVLVECLELANKAGIKPYLNSNLISLTKSRAETLKTLGIHSVLTSVIGPNAEVHDSIAQRKGAFRKTISGIRVAQEAGIRVAVSMVVSQKNLHVVRGTAQLVESLGVKSFNATKVGHPGNCSDFSSMSLTGWQFTKYLAELVAIGSETGMKCGHLEPYPLCASCAVIGASDLEARRCPAGVSTFTVSSSGDVRPCSHLDEAYGNLLSEDVATVWSRMDGWRRAAYLPEICRQCKLVTNCGGGCRMESKMHSGGNISAPDPYMRPEGIELATELRNAKVLSAKSKSDDVTMNTQFKLQELRVRKESFGASVTVHKAGSRVGSFFLNHEGLKVLEQFKAECVYVPLDSRIDWSGVEDVKGFCAMLVKKGGAIIIKKGGEVDMM